jgi:hypothetical protein
VDRLTGARPPPRRARGPAHGASSGREAGPSTAAQGLLSPRPGPAGRRTRAPRAPTCPRGLPCPRPGAGSAELARDSRPGGVRGAAGTAGGALHLQVEAGEGLAQGLGGVAGGDGGGAGVAQGVVAVGALVEPGDEVGAELGEVAGEGDGRGVGEVGGEAVGEQAPR